MHLALHNAFDYAGPVFRVMCRPNNSFSVFVAFEGSNFDPILLISCLMV